MTNLLEFKPSGGQEEETTSFELDAKSSLYDDVWFSCTPDLPHLRYTGKIPVFIWDELKTYKDYKYDVGLNEDNSEVDQYLVMTKDKYLPFRNTAKTPASGHDLLLPSSPDWAVGLGGTPFTAEKRRVSGRILNVNLEGIQALDRYYFNTALHERRKLPFVRPHGNTTEVIAWMYTIPVRNILKYMPHENSYELVRGFEPQQCSSVDGGPYTSTHSQHVY